jgi:hypothetical protein
MHALYPSVLSLVAPTLALGCVVDAAPEGWQDPPIQVAADCSYREGGAEFGRDVSAGPAVNIGGGLIGQRLSETAACTSIGSLLVVDCNSGDIIGIRGQEYGDDLSGGYAVDLLYPPQGAIELTANTTVAELAAISEREGYHYWLNAQDNMARRASHNRADLGCGCRLFYPQSAVATQ